MRREADLSSTRAELSRDDALALLGVVQELAYVRELDDVMGLVRTSARALAGADGVTFVLREGDRVFYADEDAIGPLWKGRRFPVTACVSGWSMLHGEPAVIEDVFQDPRIQADLYRPTFVKSLAMVPVRRSDPIGAIGAYWATRRSPTSREVALLQTLADTTAAALENARLYASERSLRRAAETEAVLRKELVAVVSHDLRNPLTSIGMSASLLAPLVAPLNGRARHHLDLISRSVRRIDALIHDLLDFGIIEAGELQLSPSPVALGTLFDQVTDLAPLAEEKGLRLEFQAPEEDVSVLCDLERVHQVFSNLVGNAIKFTPPNGRITVHAKVRETQVEFRVADSGPGIASEVMPHLFQRFRRTSRERGGGTGLGLSIVKGILDAHGGTISAESVDGRGAVVTFTLPRVL